MPKAELNPQKNLDKKNTVSERAQKSSYILSPSRCDNAFRNDNTYTHTVSSQLIDVSAKNSQQKIREITRTKVAQPVLEEALRHSY